MVLCSSGSGSGGGAGSAMRATGKRKLFIENKDLVGMHVSEKSCEESLGKQVFRKYLESSSCRLPFGPGRDESVYFYDV